MFMRKISFLIDRLFLNKFDRTLVKKLKFINLPWREEQRNRSSEQRTIFIQMPEDYYFLIKFYLCYLILYNEYDQNIKVNLIRISDQQFRKGKFAKLKVWRIFDRKWIRLYEKLFSGKIVLEYSKFNSSNEKTSYLNLANKIINDFLSLDDLVNFRYKDIQIGDLVFDNYLRSENKATVDLRDIELKNTLANAIYFVDDCVKVCQLNTDAILLTSYTSYTVHGVPARVFIKYGCQVRSFAPIGNYLYKIVKPSFVSHVKDFPSYVCLKEKIGDMEILGGVKTLKDRFEGKIDSSIFYMRNSNYSNNSKLGDIDFSFNKSIVIYLHCFFDSPHVYRDMSFPDFYQWIETLLKVLNERPVNVFIKKHPNAIEGNDIFLKELVKNYSNIQVLEARVSNIEIAEKIKPICALTIYGTIAYEMAFLGIPVICCGDNPQVDFKFQKTYRNRDEYIHFLKTIEDEGHYHFYHSQSRSEIEAEIGKFLYLHNSGYNENYYHEIDSELNQQLLNIFFGKSLILKEIRSSRVSELKKNDLNKIEWRFL